MDEISEYERQRNANIQAREELLRSLVLCIKDYTEAKNITPIPKSIKSKQSKQKVSRDEQQAKLTYCLRPRKLFRLATRANGKQNAEKDRKMITSNRQLGANQKKNRRQKVPATILNLPPSKITKAHLNKVATNVGMKVYDTERGTTCHQCRQKTLDIKSICRSQVCYRGRGQFCGVCLKNRYGEDVKEALLDPNWTCPVCRNSCNCSICRRRSGLPATGILIFNAKMVGCGSVHEYLTNKFNM